MSIIDSIVNYFREKKAKVDVPEGYCPNCWGYQEYEGKLRDTLHNEHIDLNNLKEKRGWIQEHVIKNFDGIKLEESEDLFTCPNCKLTYPKS